MYDLRSSSRILVAVLEPTGPVFPPCLIQRFGIDVKLPISHACLSLFADRAEAFNPIHPGRLCGLRGAPGVGGDDVAEGARGVRPQRGGAADRERGEHAARPLRRGGG